VLGLVADGEVADDLKSFGIDDVDRVAAAVGDVDAVREVADFGSQLVGVPGGVDVVWIGNRGHAGEGLGSDRYIKGRHGGRRGFLLGVLRGAGQGGGEHADEDENDQEKSRHFASV
jgi:hypothetical protein